jgi:hypothetical protein
MKMFRFLTVLAFAVSLNSVVAAPTVVTTTPAPGTTVSNLTSLSITFSEPVTGVLASDLGVNGEPADAVVGTGAGPYVFSFPQPSPGSVTAVWDTDQGIAGLGTGEFVPTGPWTYTLTDTIAPTLGQLRTSVAGQEMDNVRPTPGSTVGALTQASVTFSENVTGVDHTDLLVNGVAAESITGANAGPYIFTFPQPAVGAVNFTWAASHNIQDIAAIAFGGASWSVTLGTLGEVKITEFLAANAGTAVAVGSDADGTRDENWDLSGWIELFNTGTTTVDLLGWTLTDDLENPAQWVLPSRTLAPGASVVVWASGKDRKPVSGHLHANFGLTPAGGTLALFPPDAPAATAASSWLNYPAQRYDYSYGTQPDGAARYFNPPSIAQGAYTMPTTALPNPTAPPVPTGAANVGSALTGLTPDPAVSVGRGFFNEPFSLILTCADAAATIRYTLDGSPPLITSPAFTTALNISKTTILRATAFSPDKIPSNPNTHTYLYPATVVDQPSPPYHKPGGSDIYPNPPSPGGTPLPYTWGTNGTFTITNMPFATGTGSAAAYLTSGQIPADYGMDPKVYADPTKYDDTGAVNPTSGKTNLERINNALHTLPALSLVMKGSDMFGVQGTIYTGTLPTDPLYPTSSSTAAIKNVDKTKPCSLELIQPDGETVFTIDAGIELHGNASRDSFKNPKHGFTLRFKGKFGAGKLRANLYPDSPVKEWDKLILRGDFGGSWLHQSGADFMATNDSGSQRARGIRIREAFSKHSFRDMGRVASHHRFCNLFINGVCWGSYELMEDEAQDFAASYVGGNKDDYDVIEQHPDPINTSSATLKGGSWVAWSAMKTLLGWTGGSATLDRTTAPTAATFLTTFTNSQYEDLRTKLDMPWFQDYMIWEFFAGHLDWGTTATDAAPYMKNVYFFRPPNGTFKALPWDMENLLWHQDENRVATAQPDAAGAVAIRVPAAIHPRTRNNAEYRMEFADRAWRHLVRSNGALTPSANLARFDKWISVIGPDAIALESARWGDYRWKVHPYQTGTTTQVYTWNGAWYDGTTANQYTGSWDSGIQRFNTGRTLVSQLGTFTSGVTANAWYDEIRRLKTVYFPVRTANVLTQFRTNGLYPFLNAPELRNNATDTVLGDANLPAGTLVKLTMPAAGTGSSLGDIYYTIDGSDPRPQYDLTGTPRAGATLYSTPFVVNAPMVVKARARGTLAAFPQKPAVRAASIATVGNYTGTAGISLRGQITAAPNVLDGVTLAVGNRILMKNHSAGAANGIYVVTTLGTGTTGVWDRVTDWDADGEVTSSTWVRVTNGIQNENSVWRVTNTAAIIVGGASGSGLTLAAFSPWSALMEINLSVGPPLPTVAISEINYNPKGSQGGSAAEFVELVNYGTQPVDMTSWYLDGVEFVFPASLVLVPGQRIVVASNNNPTTFATQYPGVVVLGYFSGSLANGGERLDLYNSAGLLISSVEYYSAQPWPVGPSNGGYSLEIIDPSKDPQNPGNWRASTALKGSPGQVNGAASVGIPNVIISEFLASQGAGTTGVDFVEIQNVGTTDVDVSNWSVGVSSNGTLFDATGSYLGTHVLTPGARVIVSCTTQSVSGWRVPSTLSRVQGVIYLSDSFGASVDTVRYGPQIVDLSFGRSGNVWSLGDPTPGSVNTTVPTAPLSQLKFNEWLANPGPSADDWLELYNTNSNDPINLTGLVFEKSGEFFRIQALSAIGDESTAVLLCDQGSQRGNAVLMQLPSAGATIYLRDAGNNLLDTLAYGPQATDITQGRYPDGTGPITPLTYPSPDVLNFVSSPDTPVLNEVLVINRNADISPWAHRPSWIEIKNPYGYSFLLTDWKLRNAAGETWTFPAGTSIPTGGYLVVWADPIYKLATTQLNCGLTLAQPDTLDLMNADGQIRDRVRWGTQVADQTIGRLTDESWALLASATKGTTNSTAATLAGSSGLKINEWLADATGFTAPEFLEIYNSAASPVSTAGLWLGDEPSETGRRKWQAPALSFIGSNGYGYYQTGSAFLDNATVTPFAVPPTATSAQSINFNLSVNGEYLRLSQNDATTTAIDSLNYGRFGAGSGGRFPDGNANVQTLTPTPGYTNAAITTGPAIYEQPSPLVRTLATPAVFRIISSTDTISYQWQRNGVDIDGANGNVLDFPSVSLSDEADYRCVVTSLTGPSTSRSAKLTVLYTLSTWAQALSIGSGTTDDSDGDGFSNPLEFLLGTDPLSAGSSAQRDSVYKFIGIETSPTSMEFNLDLRLNHQAVYTQLQGQLSTDLSIWFNSNPTSTQLLSTEPNGDQNLRLKFALPVSEPRGFLKLKLIP